MAVADPTHSDGAHVPSRGPVRLVILSSAEDGDLLKELAAHLAPIQRDGRITIWYRALANAGEEVEAAAQEHLARAEIVIVLLSASILASDHDYAELTRARQQVGTTQIVPILARPVDLSVTPVAGLTIWPRGGQAVSLWADRNKAWMEVTTEIRELTSTLVTSVGTVVDTALSHAGSIPMMRDDESGRTVWSTFYSVLSGGRSAIVKLAHTNSKSPQKALLFLSFIATIGILIELPVSKIVGLDYGGIPHLVSQFLLVMALWTTYAYILHAFIRLLGGSASLASSIAAFAYSGAYFPFIMAVQLPASKWIYPMIIRAPTLDAKHLIESITHEELPIVILPSVLSSLMLVAWFCVLYQVLRRLHELTHVRMLTAYFLGLSGLIAVIFAVSLPWHHLLFSAFS